MKYADKWMVVPYIPPEICPKPSLEISNENQLSSIVNNKNLAPDQKIKLYNQNFLKKPQDLTPTSSLSASTQPEPIIKEEPSDLENLQNNLNPGYFEDTENILNNSQFRNFLNNAIAEQLQNINTATIKEEAYTTPKKIKKGTTPLSSTGTKKAKNLQEDYGTPNQTLKLETPEIKVSSPQKLTGSLEASKKTVKALKKLGKSTPEIVQTISKTNLPLQTRGSIIQPSKASTSRTQTGRSIINWVTYK